MPWRPQGIPRCKYGAELWHSFGNGQLHALQVANRFCIKHIQSLPRSSKSILVEGMIDSYSAEHSIDEKKLLFVGRLCRLRYNILAKKKLSSVCMQTKYLLSP